MDAYQTARSSRIAQWQSLAKTYEETATILEEEWKNIEDGHAELQAEKDALAEQNGGADVHDSDILDINAGGQIIRVTRGTLTQVKGTRLEAIFSGRWGKQLRRDSKGHIFLDVNPVCFKAIVDYLNERKIAPPDSPPELPSVDPENQPFLDRLLIAFGLDDHSIYAVLDESNILKDAKHVEALTGFLKEDGIQGKLTLLYRGTRDGMTATAFHQKCDNQGPTVTVARDSNGYIFGGFADKAWNSTGSYVPSGKSFLFGLHCHGGSTPAKMKVKNNMKPHALYSWGSYGPTFGGGHDLALLDPKYSNLHHSYASPNGNTSYFTGSRNFTTSEIEVFKIDPSLPVAMPRQRPANRTTPQWQSRLVLNEFPSDIQDKFKAEKEALLDAVEDLAGLREAFDKEQAAMDVFCNGAAGDIVHLNVSGRRMAVSQSTLGQFPDSVLYKQFVDPLWVNRSGKSSSVSTEEWNSEQVVAWAKKIKKLSKDVSRHFRDTTGGELLAMGRDDIKDLGIVRPGSVALVVAAIQKLRDEDEEKSALFIEHSDYCFGKIIDHMRLKAMRKLDVPGPSPPEIREPEKKRFKRIVEYYFPNDSASEFLG